MRVLVTGGAGFIGSKLAPLLVQRGHDVRILDTLSPQIHGHKPERLEWLDQPSIEFQRGSVISRDDITSALIDVDTVVHLAAETGTGQSMYEIERYNSVNSQGTALLLDSMANAQERRVKRFVLASSRSIYGEGAYLCEVCGDGRRRYPASRGAKQLEAHLWDFNCPTCDAVMTPVATNEDDRAFPASIYAATKYAQEDLARIACNSLGIACTTLRLQNVYGEGQSLRNPYTGILSIFSTRIRRGLPLPIFEDGRETRDFVHVSDVAQAFAAAVNREEVSQLTVNVGSGVGTPIIRVAQLLNQALGGNSQTNVTKQFRLGDIRHNRADISRLVTALGQAPEVAISEGLNRFADWVRQEPLPEDQLERANSELRARNLMG